MAGELFHKLDIKYYEDKDGIQSVSSPSDSISIGQDIIFYGLDVTRLSHITNDMPYKQFIGTVYDITILNHSTDGLPYGAIVTITRTVGEHGKSMMTTKIFGIKEFDKIVNVNGLYFIQSNYGLISLDKSDKLGVDITRGCFSKDWKLNNYSVELI